MLSIPRNHKLFPDCLKPIREVKGVSVKSNCKLSSNRAIAHAHHYINDKQRGWICLRWKYLLDEPLVLLHEAAHILINFHPFVAGHGKEWQEKLVEIGGTHRPFLIGRGRSVPGFDKNGRIYRMRRVAK